MRRGDLSLSTSTIVFLIVAVVVLGTILALVLHGFSSTDKMLEQQANQLPDPRAPTTGEPITASAPPRVKVGDSFAMRVSIYNGCGAQTTFIAVPSCQNPDSASAVTAVLLHSISSPNLAPGQTATITVLADVSAQTRVGRSLCTVEVTPTPACEVVRNAPAHYAIEFTK